MKILGNPILGVIFGRSSLRLLEDGLYRLVKNQKYSHRIFLTDDVKTIVELIGLEFDDINVFEVEKVLPKIIESPYCNPIVYTNLNDKGSKDLDAMVRYLTNNPELVEARETKIVRTSDIENALGIELKGQIEELKFIFDNYDKLYKAKFKELKTRLIADGYDPRDFQIDIAKFDDSFENKLDRMKCFVHQSVDELLERYQELSTQLATYTNEYDNLSIDKLESISVKLSKSRGKMNDASQRLVIVNRLIKTKKKEQKEKE